MQASALGRLTCAAGARCPSNRAQQHTPAVRCPGPGQGPHLVDGEEGGRQRHALALAVAQADGEARHLEHGRQRRQRLRRATARGAPCERLAPWPLPRRAGQRRIAPTSALHGRQGQARTMSSSSSSLSDGASSAAPRKLPPPASVPPPRRRGEDGAEPSAPPLSRPSARSLGLLLGGGGAVDGASSISEPSSATSESNSMSESSSSATCAHA